MRSKRVLRFIGGSLNGQSREPANFSGRRYTEQISVHGKQYEETYIYLTTSEDDGARVFKYVGAQLLD